MGSLVGIAYSSCSWLTLTVSKGSHSYFISHRGTQKQGCRVRCTDTRGSLHRWRYTDSIPDLPCWPMPTGRTTVDRVSSSCHVGRIWALQVLLQDNAEKNPGKKQNTIGESENWKKKKNKKPWNRGSTENRTIDAWNNRTIGPTKHGR